MLVCAKSKCILKREKAALWKFLSYSSFARSKVSKIRSERGERVRQLLPKRWVDVSVTGWQDYSFDIWSFAKYVNFPNSKNAKAGLNFCQILNKSSKNDQQFSICPKMTKYHKNWSHCFAMERATCLKTYQSTSCQHFTILFVMPENEFWREIRFFRFRNKPDRCRIVEPGTWLTETFNRSPLFRIVTVPNWTKNLPID